MLQMMVEGKNNDVNFEKNQPEGTKKSSTTTELFLNPPPLSLLLFVS
jgi:hypothetical protein